MLGIKTDSHTKTKNEIVTGDVGIQSEAVRWTKTTTLNKLPPSLSLTTHTLTCRDSRGGGGGGGGTATRNGRRSADLPVVPEQPEPFLV